MSITKTSKQYARVKSQLASDRCVLLDGAMGSELIEVAGSRPETEEHLWGMSATIDSPQHVGDLHHRYIDIGCDVVSTNTWAIPTVLHAGTPHAWANTQSVHWMDVARTAIRLARDAAEEAGRADE